MVKNIKMKYLFLLVLFLFPVTSFAQVPIPIAMDWTQSTTTPSNWYYTWHLSQAGESGTYYSELFTTVNDYDLVNHSTQCYPYAGGSSTGGGAWVDISSYVANATSTFFIGTPCNVSGTYYWVVKDIDTGNKYYSEFYYDAGSGTFTSNELLNDCGLADTPYTCIVDYNPDRDQVLSTSTDLTVSARIYVSSDDWNEDSTFKFLITHETSVQQFSKVQAFQTYQDGTYESRYSHEYTIEDWGYSDFSEVIDISDWSSGRYSYTLIIDNPSQEGWFSSVWNSLLDTLSYANGQPPSDDGLTTVNTQFVIGALTSYDTLFDEIVADRDRALVDLNAVCNPLSGSFAILSCLDVLIIPTDGQLAQMAKDFRDHTLSMFPLGYITRLIEIMSGASSVQPPALTYTFGSYAPADLYERSISFQLWDNFEKVSEIRSDDVQNKNIWEIIMPYINTVIALGVLGVIVSDLLALGLPSFGGSSSETYAKSGNVSVSQLPDQPDKSKITYNEAQSVKIKDRTRRRIM